MNEALYTILGQTKEKKFELLGRGGKFWKGEGRKYRVNKGCLAMQIRVSQVNCLWV